MSDKINKWRYSGIDLEGNEVKGQVMAATEKAAREKVEAGGISVASVIAPISERIKGDIELPQRIKDQDVSNFYYQLSGTLEAGVNIKVALNSAERQTTNKKMAAVIHEIGRDIDNGVGVADAMSKHSSVFSQVEVSTVRVGENGGFLAKSFGDLSAGKERMVIIRDKVIGAIRTPLITFSVSMVLVLVAIYFLMPMMLNGFRQLNEDAELPILTRIVMAMTANILIFLAIGAALGFLAFRWWRSNRDRPEIAIKVDRVLLKIPPFGKLVHQFALTKFLRSYAMLSSAGANSIDTIELAGKASGNLVLQNFLTEAAGKVANGKSLSDTLKEDRSLFPGSMIDLLETGEETGQIEKMSDRAALMYERETDKMTDALTDLIQPLSAAIVGGIVGFFLIAMFLPYLNLFDIINS